MKTLYAIVGHRHHPGADAVIKGLIEGDVLEIVRDQENPYDANAVQVWGDGIMLGFVPKAQAAQIAPRLDAGWAPLPKYHDDRGRPTFILEE